LAALKPPIKLLERTRWKDRDTFARLIKASLDKMKVRQLVISAEHVPGLIDKIADHLDDAMEPGAEYQLDAYQPPREKKVWKREARVPRGRTKLWKQLVASAEQARIEIRVFTKGKAVTFFFEPINADDELENEIWKDIERHLPQTDES